MGRYREMSTDKPRREASEETSPSHTLTSDFWSRAGSSKVLLFKLLCLSYFVMTALANWHTNHVLDFNLISITLPAPWIFCTVTARVSPPGLPSPPGCAVPVVHLANVISSPRRQWEVQSKRGARRKLGFRMTTASTVRLGIQRLVFYSWPF